MTQLDQLLAKISPNHHYLHQLITTEYFSRRHIKLSTIIRGSNQTEVLAFCLHHPRITEEERQFVIVHFEVVRK